MIIDYSFWRPANRQALDGVNGVIRYISRDAKKTASVAELEQLHGWGIGTALVFEDAADRATGGTSAGRDDGNFARQMLTGLEVPHGRPLYIACDFDVQDYAPGSSNPRAKLGPVADYLEEFTHALMSFGYQSGAYGGYWLVSRALDAGVVDRGWQTIGWSPSDNGIIRQDPRISLYQTGDQLFNGNADLNFAGWRDWGQFRRETLWLIGAQA